MTITLFSRLLTLVLCAAALGQTCDAGAAGLLEAYDAALLNDPVYRAARHENEAGQQFRALGRASLLPTLSANYSTYRNRADITTETPLGDRTEQQSYTSLSASIQLRQPLLHREGMAGYRQGIAQAEASDALFSVRSQEIIVRLVSVYVNAHYAQDQVNEAIAQRDAYQAQRTAAVRMQQRGEGTVTEVLEAQAKFDVSQAQVIEARDNLVNAYDALAAMVGRDIAPLDPLAASFQVRPLRPTSFDEWKATALASNPEILARRLAVDIAREEINKNRAGHWPRLDLVASANKNNSDTINTLNQNAEVKSVGVQLTVPLYAGGSVSAATYQAVANHEKAQADLDAKVSQVLVELRKQYNINLSSVARVHAATTSLSSAQLLLDATQKSVRGGQRTTLDVLNAQQQLFEARRELALARYNYLLSYARLHYAAGTLGLAELKSIAEYFVVATQ